MDGICIKLDLQSKKKSHFIGYLFNINKLCTFGFDLECRSKLRVDVEFSTKGEKPDLEL